MAKPLLLEIGVEELPASFVDSAREAMPRLAADLLARARLEHGDITFYGTPRRLALLASDVAEAQADRREQVVGPPKAVAFDAAGELTRAGQGWVKKLGKTAADVQVVETPKGAYAAALIEEAGAPATQVLPDLLSDLIPRIPFPKSMRWGEGEVAFGRPVHWLVALLGDQLLEGTEFAGVRAGRLTRGHRFLHPETLEVPHADRYVEVLRRAHVHVDMDRRAEEMHAALRDAAGRLGGVLVEDAFLIAENNSMVEAPFVVPGHIDQELMELPDQVIVSVMRDHQRYFAVADKDGKLLPHYLNVVNTAENPRAIALGNDRVLRARLKDAQFFVQVDQRAPLAEHGLRLDRVTFQNKLGSVGDKVRRIERLALALAERVPGVSAAQVQAAAPLIKADLVTEIVGEFPELQGSMGRWYALAEGVDSQVAAAIEDHYAPRGASDAPPSSALAGVLGVADRLDTLVGCFGVGIVPSGSADPFALRRAALGVMRTALEGPFDVSLRDALALAYDGFARGTLGDRDEVLGKLDEFFRGRLKHYFRRPNDTIEACLAAWPLGSLRDLERRMEALDGLRSQPAFESLAVAFKRSFNIAKDVSRGEVDEGLMSEQAERDLAAAYRALRPELEAALETREYAKALTAVADRLRAPIDRFFDEVFVMVEDAAVRDNRLRLLASIAQAVNRVAHFHLLDTTAG